MSDQSDMNRGFLKEKLGDYQVDPPEMAWDEISKKLGGGRKRRVIILLLFATAASIALTVTLGIHYFGPDMPLQELLTEQLPEKKEAAALKPEEDPIGDKKGSRPEQRVVEAPVPLADVPLADVTRQVKLAKDLQEAEEAHPATAMQQVVIPGTGQEDRAENDLDSDPEADSDPDDPIDIQLEEPLIEAAGGVNAAIATVIEQDQRRDPRWMLGAALSPLYSFRDAEAGALPENPAETGMLSYSTGVHISYRRNSRFAIETGIYYNKTGIAIGSPGAQVYSQHSDMDYVAAGSAFTDIKAVSNSVGNIVTNSGDIYMNGYKINAEYSNSLRGVSGRDQIQASDLGIQQHLDYLELPVNLRYSVIDKTIELQLVGGVSANFLVDNYVTMETSAGAEEIGYLSNVNSVNYSGNAGVGMIYHMGRQFSLIVEPRFRYFINSVNDSSLPSTRPYSLGLYTGLSYTF
jgi:hypothetical protein